MNEVKSKYIRNNIMLLLDLPDCMLEQVLEYLSHDEIAKQRIVSDKVFVLWCEQFVEIITIRLEKYINSQ